MYPEVRQCAAAGKSMLDGFGDRTKVLGKFYFELFPYRPAHADRRGIQRADYWEVNVQSKEDSLRLGMNAIMYALTH